MKKFIGAISSMAAGVLGFIWLCLSSVTFTQTIGKTTTTKNYTGWQLITGADGTELITATENFNFYKTCAIIMLVLAGLLILMGLFMALCQAKVIKVKSNFNFINLLLLVGFVVLSVLVVIAASKIAGEFTVSESIKTPYSIGLGLILNLVTSILCTISGAMPVFSKK